MLIIILISSYLLAGPFQSRPIESNPQLVETSYKIIGQGQFANNRCLDSNDFSSYFLGIKEKLQNLPSNAHILDAGAGYLRTVDQILRTFPHLNVSAITYYAGEHNDEEAVLKSPQFRLHDKKLFSQINNDQILSPFGKVDLIIDFFGILSYSPHPDIDFKRYLEFLHDDGELWLLTKSLADPKFSQVKTRNGTLTTFKGWIEKIPGIQVQTIVTWNQNLDEMLKNQFKIDGKNLQDMKESFLLAHGPDFNPDYSLSVKIKIINRDNIKIGSLALTNLVGRIKGTPSASFQEL